MDLCEVGRVGRKPAATVGVSAHGRARLDEERLARKLLYAFTFASDSSVDGHAMPATAAVVAAGGGRIVGLAGGAASPPANGKVGYYSDGARHAVVAVTSAAGRRLFLELDQDAYSSNVWEFLSI